MIRFRKYTLAHLDSLHKETGKKIFSSLMVVLACAGRPALARLLYSAAYVQRLLCTAPAMYSACLIYGDSLCTAAPYVHCCICIVLPMYSAPYA